MKPMFRTILSRSLRPCPPRAALTFPDPGGLLSLPSPKVRLVKLSISPKAKRNGSRIDCAHLTGLTVEK